jgi:hypothetical protein
MDLTATMLVTITARPNDIVEPSGRFFDERWNQTHASHVSGTAAMRICTGGGMVTYNFNVFNSDQSVAAIQSVVLGNPRAVWSKVTELAWNIGESGGQIKVTDQLGRLVVLVGVNSARRVCRSDKSFQAA